MDDDSIDFIYMVDTLHHIEQKERAFKELHRVLTPGGYVAIADTHVGATEIVDMASKQGFSLTSSEKADRFLHVTKLQKQWRNGNEPTK